MSTNKASLPVIKRLPKYYRYLRTLQAAGTSHISSRELAAQMGTTASQVRQDFNCLGNVDGRQGIGYSIDTLLAILEELLFGQEHLPAILIGCGHLGKAVSRFISRDTNGYRLIAAFDVSPEEVGQTIINDVPILPMDELESFCQANHPVVAVLCLPRDPAREVSDRLMELGIRGYWNFSHYDLSVPYPNAIVENVHLGDSLMSLGYRLRNQD